MTLRSAIALLPAAVLALSTSALAQPVDGVVLRISGKGADPAAVRRAVADELGGSVDAGSGTLLIAVDDTTATATYHAADGRVVRRTVELPADPEERIEVLALLAGNLVRDQHVSDTAAPTGAGGGALAAASMGAAPASSLAAGARPSDDAAASDASGEAPSAESPPAADGDAPAEAPSEAAAASPSAAPHAGDAEPALQPFPVNLALVSPAELAAPAREKRVAVHLGALYGDVGAVDFFRVDGLAGRTRYGARGFGAAGLWGDVGGAAAGLHLGGVGHRVSGPATGVQLGGVFATSGDATGLQASGVVQVTRGAAVGFQVAGVAQLSLGDATGFQAGELANWASGDAVGFHAAGVFDGARDVSGLQLAGVVAGARDVAGAQIGGVVNTAQRVRGVQVGLVNVAREVDGLQIGLVNVAGNARYQAVAWVDEQATPQVGFRTMWGPAFTQLSVGVNPLGFDSPTDGDHEVVFGYALGGRVEIQRFVLDLDLLYSAESTPREEDARSASALRQRASLGYQFLPWLAVFAGGGLKQRWQHDMDDFSVGPTVFGGVQLW